MIIGGVNAAGKSGGARVGVSESYLPCRVTVFGSALLETFKQATKNSLQYQAYVRIRSMADDAWINLASVTSFNVNLTTGQLGTASLTVKQREIYSPFASIYPDLLRPSNRRIQVWCGVKNYPLPVFEGHIKDYKETVSAQGGSISLELEDLRDTMSRQMFANIETPNHASLYRILQNLIGQSRSNGAVISITSGRNIVLGQSDGVTAENLGTMNDYTIADIIRRLSPGTPLPTISGTGTFSLSQDDATVLQHPAFEYDDNSLLKIDRKSGANAFNYVRTYGLVNGVGTASYVQDAVDVAKRGIIVYPPGYVGGPDLQLSYSNSIALGMIARQLEGDMNWEVQMNPYLNIGTNVRLSSVKAGLASCVGSITTMSHSFSASQARTSVTAWRGA